MTELRKQQIERQVKDFFGQTSDTSKLILDALHQNGNGKNKNGCSGNGGVKKKG